MIKREKNKIMKNTELLTNLRALCIAAYNHSKDYKNAAMLDATEGADYYHQRKPIAAVTGGSSTVEPIVKVKVDDAAVQIMDIISKLKDGTSVVPKDYSMRLPEPMIGSIINLVDNTLWGKTGHKILRSAVRDALICGTSALYWYVEEEPIINIEMYTGDNRLNKLEMEILKADLLPTQKLTIVSEEKIKGMPADSDMGNTLYEVKVVTTKKQKTVKYKNINFNRLQIDPTATSISDANYVGIKTITTKAELIAAGYPKEIIDQCTREDLYEYKAEVNTGIEFLTNYRLGSFANDRQMDNLIVYEHFIKTTLIDGELGLYRVSIVGQTIIDISQEDEIPVVELTPIPNITAIWGSSFAYQLRSQQDIATALKRGYIDNIHNANHGRYYALKGQYNKRDLMDNRPGGIVEVDTPNAVTPFIYNPLPQGIDALYAMNEKTADDISGISQEMLGRGENSWATGITASQVAITHSKGDLTIKDYAQGIVFGIQELACGIYNTWRKVIGKGPNDEELPAIADFKMRIETESGRRSKANDAIQAYTALSQTKFMTPQLEFELIRDYLACAENAKLAQFLKPVQMVMQEMSQPNQQAQLNQQLVQEQISNLQAQTKLTLQKADIEADVAASEQNREDTRLQLDMQSKAVELSLADRKHTNDEFQTAIEAEIAQKDMQTRNLVAAYEMKYKEMFAGGDLMESLGGNPVRGGNRKTASI